MLNHFNFSIIIIIVMMQHNEIQNHIRFKKLLEDRDPSAVAIYASFTTSKDSSQFNKAVNQLFSSSKTRAVPAAAAVPAHGSVNNANNSSAVCNALWKTGKCRYGSSCRFSHQLNSAPSSSAPSAGEGGQGRSRVVHVKPPPNGIHQGVRRAGPTSPKTSDDCVDMSRGPSDDKTAGACNTQRSLIESEIASTTTSQPIPLLHAKIANPEYDPRTILGTTVPREGAVEATEDRVNSLLASKILSSLTMDTSTSDSSDRPARSRFMGLFSRGTGDAVGGDRVDLTSSPSHGLHHLQLQPSVGSSFGDVGDQWLRDLALIGAPRPHPVTATGGADGSLIFPATAASTLVVQHPQLHALPPPGLVVQRSSVEPSSIAVGIQPPTLSTAAQPPTLSTAHQMTNDSSNPTAPPGRSSQGTDSPFRVSSPTPASTSIQQQQQRSRALLSLLKSGKVAGPFQPPSASKSIELRSSKNDHPSCSTIPPPVDTTTTAAAAAAQPIGDIDGSIDAPSDQAGTDKHPSSAPVAKKAPLFRTTKFQIGAMQIIVNGVYRMYQIMRPTTNMIVRWQLHQSDYESIVAASGGTDHIVIGLVRYGSYTNSPCIVAKPIDKAPRLFRDERLYKGQIVFHAPKSAGQFVFRMFDQSSKEAALHTLASSPLFTVELLMDEDVSTNLMHVLTAFDDGDNKLKGLSQLPSVLRGIRGGGVNMRDHRGASSFSFSSRSANYLNECVSITLSAIRDTSASIDAWTSMKLKLKAAVEKEEFGRVDSSGSSGSSSIASPDLLPPSGKEIDALRASSKHALKVQAEVHESLLALMQSKASWYLLSEQQKMVTKAMQGLYCPHLQRYFRSLDHMQQVRKQEWGFAPAIDSAQSLHDSRGGTSWILINHSIDQLLPSLLPSDSFALVRVTSVARLQRALLSERVIAPGTEVVLYGSSCNNFGSEGADMDLTLLFPKGVDVANEDKPAMIDSLSAALGRIGMLEIKTRSTARIPIVQFRDPMHSLHCDISINNQLAVANTRLLRTYGNIDMRVRGLVFLVKHWAKRRHLNSPSDGTLSSYGFIICILHFLQVGRYVTYLLYEHVQR